MSEHSFSPEFLSRYGLMDPVGISRGWASYRMRQTNLGRPVLVMVLVDEPVRPRSVDQILAQARAAAAVSHPGIVTILDVGTDGSRPFVVYEHVDGERLIDRLRRAPSLRLPEVLRIVVQMLDALAAAHGRGVVHGGLNPENIILAAPTRPRIGDLGIGDVRAKDSAVATAGGCPPEAYLSPEQCEGDGATISGDLYAAGVILFEMVAGQRPFQATEQGDLIAQQLSQPTPDLRALRPDLPAELQSLVVCALEKRPDRRFRRAQDFIRLAMELLRSLTPGPRTTSGAGVASQGERQTIEPGFRISSRYELVRVLGEGGMGKVWLARDLARDGAQVAIKVLPPEMWKDADARASLQQEANMSLKLSHPNVVRLFNLEPGDPPVLVMEYVNGKTLAEELAQRKLEGRDPMHATEALPLLEGLAAAVDHAHDRGVIHRDIKPSNVLMAVGPMGRVVPKLGDFGIAAEFGSFRTRLTGAVPAGTLAYMSPEQVACQRLDARTDIYSLAATLYQMLTFSPPFVGGDLASAIKNERVPVPCGVPPAVAAVVMSGLEKVREDRPASAAILVMKLRFAIEHLSAAQTLNPGRAPPDRFTSIDGIASTGSRSSQDAHTEAGVLAPPPTVREQQLRPAHGAPVTPREKPRLRWDNPLDPASDTPAAAPPTASEGHATPNISGGPPSLPIPEGRSGPARQVGRLPSALASPTHPGSSSVAPTDDQIEGFNVFSPPRNGPMYWDPKLPDLSPTASANNGASLWRRAGAKLLEVGGWARAAASWRLALTVALTIGLGAFFSAFQADAPMVLIPGGEFLMGSEGDDSGKPVHRVYVDAFYMDKYLVTNKLYRRFVQATGYRNPAYWNDSKFMSDDQPVVGVSWEDAVAYCHWADKRLPTEAEWEKAARGGLEGKLYPWGDEDPAGRAWYFQGSSGLGGPPVSVGKYAANDFGLFDIVGNGFQWCADWYGEHYYERSPARNPTGPDSGTYRVLRGGAWALQWLSVRSVGIPTSTNEHIGFRCARSLTGTDASAASSAEATMSTSTKSAPGTAPSAPVPANSVDAPPEIAGEDGIATLVPVSESASETPPSTAAPAATLAASFNPERPYQGRLLPLSLGEWQEVAAPPPWLQAFRSRSERRPEIQVFVSCVGRRSVQQMRSEATRLEETADSYKLKRHTESESGDPRNFWIWGLGEYWKSSEKAPPDPILQTLTSLIYCYLLRDGCGYLVEFESTEGHLDEQAETLANVALHLTPPLSECESTRSKQGAPVTSAESLRRRAASALRIENLAMGRGESPKRGQTLVIHYTGWLADGSEFDSSLFKFHIGLGEVIKGWDVGLASMAVGGKRRLTVPPQLGYGWKGAPPAIPPNATLIYDVELLAIEQ